MVTSLYVTFSISADPYIIWEQNEMYLYEQKWSIWVQKKSLICKINMYWVLIMYKFQSCEDAETNKIAKNAC